MTLIKIVADHSHQRVCRAIDTGERAAKLLLRILAGARPKIARVTVPALVRGDELITATGCYGDLIRECQRIERALRDLQDGLEMVEELARHELGMVKPNEVFVQIAQNKR